MVLDRSAGVNFSRAVRHWLPALSLSSWFPQPRCARGQSNPLPAAPGFTALPATAQQLATGQPLPTSPRAGRQPTWAVDALGVAHVYEPLQERWAPFDRGVDAATVIGATFYLFRDDEVAIGDPTAGPLSVQRSASCGRTCRPPSPAISTAPLPTAR
jgi:hypothetical protein